MIILKNTQIRYMVMKFIRKRMVKHHRKQLNNSDFTIISNNCWGGLVYQYYGIPYLSPTVGMYFYADDYLKFIKDLRYYFGLELNFISYMESKYKEHLLENGYTNIPIGVLDDVEIVFLHCKTPEEAREKWNRRRERVNYDNIIIKFSQQNLCREEHLKAFEEFEYDKKLMFVNKNRPEYPSSIYHEGYEKEDGVLNDTKFFYDYMDLTEFINRPVCPYRMGGEQAV